MSICQQCLLWLEQVLGLESHCVYFIKLQCGLDKLAMDVYETDISAVAELDIPNFELENVNVPVEDGALRGSGTVEDMCEEKEKEYWRREIPRLI